MEEVHGLGVATVLAADADLEAGPGGPALVDRDPHHAADAVGVQRLEWRDPEHAQVDVAAEERALHVVAGEAPAHLGEVVRAEREELGRLRDLPGGHRGPRHLDHRADQRVRRDAGLRRYLGEHPLGLLARKLQLLHRADQRNHDLRLRVAAVAHPLRRGVRDRADLHGVEAGDDQAEADAAQAEHRVLLVQAAHRVEQFLVLVRRVIAGQRDLDREVGEVGQELVQRRVEQPDGDRQPVHRLQDLHEVAALQRLKRIERGLPRLVVVGQDQPLDQLPPLAEEHVLGPGESDALGAEPDRARRVLAGIGIGPDAEAAALVSPCHDPVHGADQLIGIRFQGALEVLHHRGGHHRDLAEVDHAGGAVDGDDVTLADRHSPRRGEAAARDVDLKLVGAAHAGLAHPAGDHRRVAGLAAAAGQDAARGDHAVQVVRVGLAPDQDDVLAGRGQLDRARGLEHDLADRRARRCADALRDLLDVRARVEPGEHQLGKLVAGDPVQRLVKVDQALVDELDGDPERGTGGALAHPGLQHPQLAALDRELDVAQVPVVVLQRLHDLHQLAVGLRVDLLQVLQRHRVADAGHHILALGVLQVVPVDTRLPAARIAGERDPGAGVHAEVAEHHRDHIDRGAQVGRDPLLPPVEDRPVGVPRVEDGPDRQVKLLAGVLREVVPGVLADDPLEGVHDPAQVAGVQVQVVLGALRLLRGIDRVLEGLALDVEYRLAEHLDQPPVGIPGEPLAARLLRQAVHRLIGQADVQHGLHHPRHGELGP